jgi:hypothetical protein
MNRIHQEGWDMKFYSENISKLQFLSRRLAGFFVPVFLALAAFGCATQDGIGAHGDALSAMPTASLEIEPEGPFTTYLINVKYIDQDEIGLPAEIREIEGHVQTGRYLKQGYYKWIDYRIRTYKPDKPPGEWISYSPAIDFEYLLVPVNEEPDYLGNLPATTTLPRELDGFYFYINLIDFHMWDLFVAMFMNTRTVFPGYNKDPLKQIGDAISFDLRDLPIGLLEWENVTSDLKMTGGTISAELIGMRRTPEAAEIESEVEESELIVFFQQQQTLEQNVYAGNLKMPFTGTNRFMGHMYLSSNNELLKAHYTEYVYAKVYAPMSQTVIVHTERQYRIERVE